MHTLTFTATEAGIHEDEDVLVAGVRAEGSELYVTFQREPEDYEFDEDWGIHFEFNDQINGAYECMRHCTLSRRRLHVELSRPIDPQKQITVVDVELAITAGQFKKFAKMLLRIFREREALLTVVDDQ